MYRVDVYLRVRRAVMVEGKSIREVSREFGLHRDTVRKMPPYSVPPGYRRQRHTAERIFERLRDEYGFDGGYTVVKDYAREYRRRGSSSSSPIPSKGSGRVRHQRSWLVSDGNGPLCHLCAGRTLIPAMAAAVS